MLLWTCTNVFSDSHLETGHSFCCETSNFLLKIWRPSPKNWARNLDVWRDSLVVRHNLKLFIRHSVIVYPDFHEYEYSIIYIYMYIECTYRFDIHVPRFFRSAGAAPGELRSFRAAERCGGLPSRVSRVDGAWEPRTL